MAGNRDTDMGDDTDRGVEEIQKQYEDPMQSSEVGAEANAEARGDGEDYQMHDDDLQHEEVVMDEGGVHQSSANNDNNLNVDENNGAYMEEDDSREDQEAQEIEEDLEEEQEIPSIRAKHFPQFASSPSVQVTRGEGQSINTQALGTSTSSKSKHKNTRDESVATEESKVDSEPDESSPNKDVSNTQNSPNKQNLSDNNDNENPPQTQSSTTENYPMNSSSAFADHDSASHTRSVGNDDTSSDRSSSRLPRSRPHLSRSNSAYADRSKYQDEHSAHQSRIYDNDERPLAVQDQTNQDGSQSQHQRVERMDDNTCSISQRQSMGENEDDIQAQEVTIRPNQDNGIEIATDQITSRPPDSPSITQVNNITVIQNADPSAYMDTALDRPAIDKDFLDHDIFDEKVQETFASSIDTDTESQENYPPPVLLTYKSRLFHLFSEYENEVPSSASTTESPDHQLIFTTSNEKKMYHLPLERFFKALETIFPQFATDEMEIILNFEILGLEIPQDSIYVREVSLYDIDRLHVGCQLPGRLSFTLREVPRLALRFNTLAKHVRTLIQQERDGIYSTDDSDHERIEYLPEYAEDSNVDEGLVNGNGYVEEYDDNDYEEQQNGELGDDHEGVNEVAQFPNIQGEQYREQPTMAANVEVTNEYYPGTTTFDEQDIAAIPPSEIQEAEDAEALELADSVDANAPIGYASSAPAEAAVSETVVTQITGEQIVTEPVDDTVEGGIAEEARYSDEQANLDPQVVQVDTTLTVNVDGVDPVIAEGLHDKRPRAEELNEGEPRTEEDADNLLNESTKRLKR